MRKILIIVIVAPILLLAALAIYLKTSNLSELRPYVCRFVSKLINRPLVIEGAFSVKIGTEIRVEAEKVRLANLPWASTPSMAEVDSVSVTLDIRSLFYRPVRFVTSSARGGRLNLEKNPDGVGNWELGKEGKKKKSEESSPPLIIDQLKVSNIDVSYVDRSSSLPPVHLNVEEGEGKVLANKTYPIKILQAKWKTNHIQLHGVIGKLPDLIESDLTVEGSGPDVSPLAALAKINLPAGPYVVRGRVERQADGFHFNDFLFESGGHRLSLQGKLGSFPKLIGTDFQVEGSGPGLSPLRMLTTVELPAGPYSARGRIERNEDGFRFQNFLFVIGAYRLLLDGRLGNFPRFNGTDFKMEAKGPNLLPLSHMMELPPFPAERPFEVVSSLSGNPKRFKSDNFKVRIGGSDFQGSFNVDLTKEPPELAADLRSRRVDITWLGLTEKEAKSKEAEKKQLIIPSEPLHFDFLKKMDGHLRWKAGAVVGNILQTQNVFVDVSLKEGVLKVARAEGSRGVDEKLKLELLLEPVEKGYHIWTKFQGEKLRLGAIRENAEKFPHIDLNVDFEGRGESLREFALSGNGKFYANASKGVMDAKVANYFGGDLFKTIASTLNPFRGEKKDATLECTVLVAHLDKGEAKLDALAVRTDTATIAGDGHLQFEKEKLAFEWVAKPRTGIGLSASSLSEPYVKLGGTLADPRLEVKVVSAGVSTGLAVATFGLSVIAKGVWNRMSADKDICKGVKERFGLDKSL